MLGKSNWAKPSVFMSWGDLGFLCIKLQLLFLLFILHVQVTLYVLSYSEYCYILEKVD